VNLPETGRPDEFTIASSNPDCGKRWKRIFSSSTFSVAVASCAAASIRAPLHKSTSATAIQDWAKRIRASGNVT
jgi:hypothetical protein